MFIQSLITLFVVVVISTYAFFARPDLRNDHPNPASIPAIDLDDADRNESYVSPRSGFSEVMSKADPIAEIDLDDADRDESYVSRRSGFLTQVVQGIIKAGITGGSINCIHQAAAKCQNEWDDKLKTLTCAKDYLKANQGKCAFGIKS